MSDTIKRFFFAFPLALMVTTNANSASAQQAGPPPIPEPELPPSDTVALAPIDVPPSPSPASSERTSTQQSPSAPRRSVPLTVSPGASVSRGQRIAIAAAATTLVAGITELGILYGLNDWIFNYPSPVGAPIFFTSFLLSFVTAPTTYWAVSRAFGGQGSYEVAVAANLAGLALGAGAAYGVAFVGRGSPIISLLVYPLTVVAITALGYEISHNDATRTSRAQASNRTRILPSIFASSTSQGITFSGSF